MGRCLKEQWNIQIHSVEEWSLTDSGQKGIEIAWSSIHGFGTFQYIFKNGEYIIVDKEFMSDEFVEEVLILAFKQEV